MNSKEIPMEMSNEKPDAEYDYIEGFLTSKGRFVDRWQGCYAVKIYTK